MTFRITRRSLPVTLITLHTIFRLENSIAGCWQNGKAKTCCHEFYTLMASAWLNQPNWNFGYAAVQSLRCHHMFALRDKTSCYCRCTWGTRNPMLNYGFHRVWPQFKNWKRQVGDSLISPSLLRSNLRSMSIILLDNTACFSRLLSFIVPEHQWRSIEIWGFKDLFSFLPVLQ